MLNRNYIGTKPRIMISIDQIYTIHYFEYIKNFYGTGEAHPFWEMVYVDCGQIEATAGNHLFPLHHGEAYFHKPDEYHNIVSANKYSSVFIISYSTSSAGAAFFHNRKVTLSEFERGLISLILKENASAFAGAPDIMDQTQLVRNHNAPFGGEQVIKMLLEHLLISIVRSNSPYNQNPEPSPGLQSVTKQDVVDSVINILTRNLYNQLTLDEICQQVAFSKSYVGKLFKDSMGCGIMGYFTRIKINEAKRLISEGELNFSAIADRLNFGSLHYFSRIFKQYIGMNPSEYAKSVKKRGLL